jgi:uncharacterized protein
MVNPVIHFEVIGKDGDKLKSYYSELFGWEINSDNPMNYGTIGDGQGKGPGGEGIGGGIASMPEGGDGYVTFYVEVPSVEEALAKAESLGGTRVMGPMTMDEPPLTLGQFTDPEGHVIGLVSGM